MNVSKRLVAMVLVAFAITFAFSVTRARAAPIAEPNHESAMVTIVTEAPTVAVRLAPVQVITSVEVKLLSVLTVRETSSVITEKRRLSPTVYWRRNSKFDAPRFDRPTPAIVMLA